MNPRLGTAIVVLIGATLAACSVKGLHLDEGTLSGSTACTQRTDGSVPNGCPIPLTTKSLPPLY